jgi:quercetin dioxygenase-like cupin family protein
MSNEQPADSNESRAIVKAADGATRRPVKAGTATETQILLGPEEGMSNFFMRRFTMGPEGGMPLHTNSVEHEQYVLEGRARVTIGEKAYEVKKGDVLYIPAGTPHKYEVLEPPFQFLCLIPNQEDRIRVVEEDRE